MSAPVCTWGSDADCGQPATHEECVRRGGRVRVVRHVCDLHRRVGEANIARFGWRDGFYRPITQESNA